MKKYAFSAKNVLATVLGTSAAVFLFAGSVFALAPSVITNGSPAVTSTTATVSAIYNTNTTGGADTSFQWGITTSLGTTINVGNNPLDASTFSTTITGLTPSTNYFVRARIMTSAGPAYGEIVPFTTPSGLAIVPSVITSGSPVVTTNTATLHGIYNGNGVSTDTQFLWGTSATSLSNSTGFVTQPATSGSFTVTIPGLSPNTNYYFQAVARNNGGTSYGEIVPFTTHATSSGSPCRISIFFPASPVIAPNSATTLSWSTANCTTGSINNGIGNITPISSGSISTGLLASTRTFTLTATNGTTTDTYSVTVTVSTTSTVCALNSFFPNVASITTGSSTTLMWNTTGCTSLTLSGGIYSGYTLGSSSSGTSLVVGPLYTDTTYTLVGADANGNAMSRSTTVNVSQIIGSTNCAITAFYASPSSVSMGTSTNLIWNTTSGCRNISISSIGVFSYANSGSNATGALYNNTTYTLTAYDIYGATNTNQIYVSVVPVIVPPFTTVPPPYSCQSWMYLGTNGCAYPTTPIYTPMPSITQNPSQQIIYVNENDSNTVVPISNVITKNVTLAITSPNAIIQKGDMVSYMITYTNGTEKTIRDATLAIMLPQELIAMQTSQGIIATPTTINVALGTLIAGQTGTLTVTALADQNVGTQMLLANSTLTYTNSDGTSSTVMASFTSNTTNQNNLAGFAFGSGFFPTSGAGWLLIIVIILVIIVVARQSTRTSTPSNH